MGRKKEGKEGGRKGERGREQESREGEDAFMILLSSGRDNYSSFLLSPRDLHHCMLSAGSSFLAMARSGLEK